MNRLYVFIGFLIVSSLLFAQDVIRVNQVGYLPEKEKSLLIFTSKDLSEKQVKFVNILSGEEDFRKAVPLEFNEYGNFPYVYRLFFGEFNKEGRYKVEVDSLPAVTISINKNAYDGSADYLLNYMRQQRCGYNPYLDDSCHTGDGFRIYHPEDDSLVIDVIGGWHDASDYLQYVTTSANATYRMLMAYRENPTSFGDKFDERGKPGKNGIPDILDEAKWGLDWLVKMNPAPEEMYNQIADDRDHLGFRLPTEDTVYYGMEKNRPVYFCTGEPQGVMKYQNRANGIASTAAKYASAFALGSSLLREYYPHFASEIAVKAEDAYLYGEANPGVCQTAPCRAPYFYEEDNWVDDMQLAAASLNLISGSRDYNYDAAQFGREEITTPWMGADTANHYQWYPFSNLGHYLLASGNSDYSGEFLSYIEQSINKTVLKSESNPLNMGVPFIWCSNNLVSELLNQIYLYGKLTGSDRYIRHEAVHLDWLFGVNPWGTSMIVGYPQFGDFPEDPHSAFTHVYGYPVNGGLVDGPVYATIYGKLKGLKLGSEDEYADYQSDYIVYHDDWGDYSTNEPTMDGTASLTLYFSSLENKPDNDFQYSHGAIIRGSKTKKNIALAFTGHEFAEGGESILETLENFDAKGSFFFTGDFLRNPEFSALIDDIILKGHYTGAHSDKHLLYADWNNRDSLLVTREDFFTDLTDNYRELMRFGVLPSDSKYYLPPYEWYNESISKWCEETGLHLVNFSPGTYSNADYTTPDLSSYRESREILKSIITKEENEGLNGFILLMHVGAGEKRSDKFFDRLPELLEYLATRGYNFVKINELLQQE
ncbi:MAG: hypothetical protein SCALA702_22560 [Melioribacteraceae bacterium]|nr:MAG: hypothetical protein SCALA702_22560 [Melioribacteraceae bacterium]